MKKILIITFVLLSVNGFCNDLQYYLGHYHDHNSYRKIFIIIEKINQIDDPLEKKILKSHLSIEAQFIENDLLRSIEERKKSQFEGDKFYRHKKLFSFSVKRLTML